MHNPLTDLLEIHFLNLSAAQEIDVQKDPIEKQQKLVNRLRFIATTSPILQILNEQIDVLTLNPVERKLYESRMKLKSDIATISEVQFSAGLERGKSIGLAEGEVRGSRQAKIETARILKQFGDSISKIVQATGLTKEEVEAIGIIGNV